MIDSIISFFNALFSEMINLIISLVIGFVFLQFFKLLFSKSYANVVEGNIQRGSGYFSILVVAILVFIILKALEVF